MSRIIKTVHMSNNVWLTSYNMWICDTEHNDTCHWWITPTKPTQRQMREFKKDAKKWFRYGTREEQRRLREVASDLNYALPA